MRGLMDPDGHRCQAELPMDLEQHGASPGHRAGFRRCRQAPVTHGMRTGSSAGPESPGRQQQSAIYSAKQPANKPEECLFFFLCGREIKADCLSPGNAGTPRTAPPQR